MKKIFEQIVGSVFDPSERLMNLSGKRSSVDHIMEETLQIISFGYIANAYS